MKLIEFPEQTVIIAKDQPQYLPLPAHVDRSDPEGRVTCCWHLSLRERLRVLLGGVIWHQILTFNGSLQPQLLLVRNPLRTTRPKRRVDLWHRPYNGGWVWFDRTLWRRMRGGWIRADRKLWWCVLGFCGSLTLQSWPWQSSPGAKP